MEMLHEYSTNIYLPGNLNHLTVRKSKSAHGENNVERKNPYSSNHLQKNALYFGKKYR